MSQILPDFLCHYYEKSRGPFLSLSALPPEEAQVIQNRLKQENQTFAAHRFDGYLERRRELEHLARELFVGKGGKPEIVSPHYMVVGECPWLQLWYLDGACVKIPAEAFDHGAVSFTYGDMFPTFSPRVTDGREYRGKLYTWDEILEVIGGYGLPRHWNPEGKLGPERYIEAQVWSDAQIAKYLK